MINTLVCIHLYRQLFLSVAPMENPILHTMAFVDYFLFPLPNFYEDIVILLTSKYSSVSHSMHRHT